ncbi:hypothetical protein SESBI_41874 [Sesbania bispinosa]|nr:hypothetical protein SESBI_41874 [Sesbania bispinosa]
MAGLQQYNFFPTDFFYPRPSPSAETTSVKPTPTVVPMETPKGEIQNHPQSVIKVPPPKHALVCTSKTHQYPIDKKLSKLSTKPHSLLAWMEEEEAF